MLVETRVVHPRRFAMWRVDSMRLSSNMAFSPCVVLTPESKAVEGVSRKIKVEQKDADRCQFLRVDKLIQFQHQHTKTSGRAWRPEVCELENLLVRGSRWLCCRSRGGGRLRRRRSRHTRGHILGIHDALA